MKFKEKDRIHVYDLPDSPPFKATVVRADQSALKIEADDKIIVMDWRPTHPTIVHPKQCRLLKQKLVRSFWIHPGEIPNERDCYVAKIYGPAAKRIEGLVEFVEKRKKK